MAAWTAKIWNETAYMLEHGTEKCNMQRSTMHVNCTGYLPVESGQSGTKKNPGRLHQLQNAGWNTSDVEVVRTGRGVYFEPGEAMMNVIRRETERRSRKQEQLETNKNSYSQAGKYGIIFYHQRLLKKNLLKREGGGGGVVIHSVFFVSIVFKNVFF